MPDTPYALFDLDADEIEVCTARFTSHVSARSFAHRVKLRAYEIWHNGRRVEKCDPYDGSDDRAAQACGSISGEQPS